MKLALASIGVLVGLAACGVAPDDGPEDACARSAEHASRVETFYVVGHRGAAAREIENTIPSMKRAIADGANAVEVDLSMTKDGVVILWHDWDPDSSVALARQADGEANQHARPRVPPLADPFRRPIDELTFAEVREHFGYMVGDEPAQAEIPTLDELLAWAASEPALGYVLFDVKIPDDRADRADVMIPAVLSAIAARAPSLSYVLLVASETVYERAAPLVPDGAISFDVDPGAAVVDDADCSESSSARALARGSGHASTVIPKGPGAWSAVQTLLGCDLDARDRRAPPVPTKVFVATTDARDEAACFVDMGVDGVLTNDPASLRAVAGERRPVSR